MTSLELYHQEAVKALNAGHLNEKQKRRMLLLKVIRRFHLLQKNFALVSIFTLFRSFPPLRYAVGPSYLAF